MSDAVWDVVVVGGGIVGAATARALAVRHHRRVLLLEAEERPAAHQSGHNSGVIHAGLYYPPGSLKARLCVAGRQALYEFCARNGLPYRRCGKLLVATDERQLARLDLLLERGRANGLAGLARLGPGQISEHEPEVEGRGALFVPETGVADFVAVAHRLLDEVRDHAGAVVCAAPLRAVRRQPGSLVVETPSGDFETRFLVACCGLESDRVARLCGLDPGLRIVPIRGEYFELPEARRYLVRALVYPVPDPTLPFLGVHLTRTVDGRVTLGPNAVLALSRHGYDRRTVSPRDLAETLGYPGFWRLLARNWRSGLQEMRRTTRRRAFLDGARSLVPALQSSDLRPAPSGVRAQAVRPDGSLVDDFHIVRSPRMLHVLNAPSPAATASLAIGEHLAEQALEAP